MKYKYRYLLALPVLLFVTGFIRGDEDIFFKISKSIDLFGRVYKEVALNYVDNIDPEEFMLSGIKGMLTTLDPYTNFIDETQKKDLDFMTKGKYGGIGASVGLRNNRVTIIDLIEGYSAQRQGIRIGDIIKEINGVSITRENYDLIGEYLQGEPGEIVKMVIEREGDNENLIFNMPLEEVQVKNITYYGFFPAASNNAYLKLSSFSRSAGDEIRRAIGELSKQKKIEAIVLDLRGNPGGLLDQAIDVAEKFLKKDQLIVSVIGRDTTKITKYFAKEEPVASDKKLVVLVNEQTASASEIVAGAIQDHDRGIIIGTQSFGKGLVQTLVPMPYNSSLKITTARYYTPSGRCIQKINYSDQNKVITNNPIKSVHEYQTDNNRKVYASGGIEPDTVVTNNSSSRQVEQLLARGMFFRFATSFFNNNSDMSLDTFTKDEYLIEFISYLRTQEYSYSMKSEKLLQELKELVEKEGYGVDVKTDVENLISKLNDLKIDELELYRDDVVSNIRKELVARIKGRDARILESLTHDKQIELALKILGEEKTYINLLALAYSDN
ncbi:MAG: S41 family peptidase [Melioribacteraceae bacterium]|nr:S41 family peptidase [Melioribacteraceae bacterium]